MRLNHCWRWMRVAPASLLAMLVLTASFVSAPAANAAVTGWGYNGDGGLGDGSGVDRDRPVDAIGLPGATMIAGGYDFSLAVLANGTVWSWGRGDEGQLGTGGTDDEMTPVQIPGLADMRSVALGYGHSLALGNDGAVWSWGVNGYGQLGDGTFDPRLTPGPVLGLPADIVAIGCGRYHSLALTASGQVWAWGANTSGQLGDGTTTDRALPVALADLPAFVAIDGGSGFGAGFPVSGGYTIALATDGSVWTWGANDVGQLGDGTFDNRSTPAAVPGVGGAVGIAGGLTHAMALLADGTVLAWGGNQYGQLGDGTLTDSNVPVQVLTPDGLEPLSGISAISAGFHSLALEAGGQLLAWGYNFYGEVGDGTSVHRNLPVRVDCVSGVTLIAAADYHSLAIGGNACTPTAVDRPHAKPSLTGEPVARWSSVARAADVEFELTRPGAVEMAIFDAPGRRVAGLVDATLAAGRHVVRWNGRAASGEVAARGVYFVRLAGAGVTGAAKFVVPR